MGSEIRAWKMGRRAGLRHGLIAIPNSFDKGSIYRPSAALESYLIKQSNCLINLKSYHISHVKYLILSGFVTQKVPRSAAHNQIRRRGGVGFNFQEFVA